jgi:hypothetical protein
MTATLVHGLQTDWLITEKLGLFFDRFFDPFDVEDNGSSSKDLVSRR